MNTDPKQSELLTDILQDSENEITLFNDGAGTAYARIKIDSHYEIWPLQNKVFRQWLTKKFWEIYKNTPRKESISEALSLAEAKAKFEGPQHELYNRFAIYDDSIFYDLANANWQQVKITSSGWGVLNNGPILFKRQSHHVAHVEPQRDGDIGLLLHYVNISDPGTQLLLLVFVVSCFVPNIAHTVLVLHGPQGSSKSLLSKFLRKMIDPSIIDAAHFPNGIEELIQILAHHAFIIFDNVSYISPEASDLLCKAVTGSGFSKRQLYTDDEDIIYSFRRCIGINGINLISTRPDLLERSLLIELERISPEKRKSEEELLKVFERDLPLLLSGIFDTLAKAMSIRPTIQIPSLPRMADFALWGCAIAEALGYTKEDFLRAYDANIEQQRDTALSESSFAQTVLSFMEGRSEYIETPTILYKTLTDHAAFNLKIDTRGDSWPKAANYMTRRLNELKINLADAGIGFSLSAGHGRTIKIYRIQHNFNSSVRTDNF